MSVRIIVADDHPLARSGVRAMLRNENSLAVVAEAASPEELMDVLSRHPCDVLIADLTMPGQEPDGLPMLKRVQCEYPEIKIVLLTAAKSRRLLHLALVSGVKRVVDKSAAMGELLRAVNSVMGGKVHIGQSALRELQIARESGVERGEISRLSPREAEVLRLIAARRTVSQIALIQQRSVATISHQKISAMRKLGITTDAELHVFLSDIHELP